MNNYVLIHDLLTAVEHQAVRNAVTAYDAALAAQTGHCPPLRDARRKAAEAALRAEHLAAVLDDRPPTLTAATLTAADEATVDDEYRTAALAEAVRRRMAALDAAVGTAGAPLWHAVAVARAAALRDDPNLDTPPPAVAALWGQLRIPALAWVPAVVARGGLHRWDVPSLIGWGLMPGQKAELAAMRQTWDEHVWSQMALAEGRGWRLDGSELRLLTPWPTGARSRPMLVAERRWSPPNRHVPAHWDQRIDEGSVVWVGTGPNGERGATLDDIAALQTVTLI